MLHWNVHQGSRGASRERCIPRDFIFLIQNHQKSRNSRAKSTATIKKPKQATHERETTRRLPDSTKVFTDQRRYPRVARERLCIHAKVFTGQHTSSKSSEISAFTNREKSDVPTTDISAENTGPTVLT